MSDVTLPIWPGSSSFFPGDTPFGFYDNDPSFQIEIEATADWCAKRLGHGLSDVELQDKHFFAAFEEAVNEYGQLVNTYAARDNLINLLGISTGSNVNLSQAYVTPSNHGIIEISKEYGNVLGTGGTQVWFTGSIDLVADKQVYDFRNANVESGSFTTDKFTIRKVFHNDIPATLRSLDPEFYMSTEFGWTNTITSPTQYIVMPLFYNMLKTQAIEFNDMFRKSAYTFQITGTRLRIFPIPTNPIKLYFHYTLDNQSTVIGLDGSLNPDSKGKISDASNIPYGNVIYNNINAMGKQWIRKYTLAICKEILGYIRGKYASVPIADGEVTLNSADLLTAGKEEKDGLVADFKEILDQMSRQTQLERKQAEAESLNSQLKWYPTKIYIR